MWWYLVGASSLWITAPWPTKHNDLKSPRIGSPQDLDHQGSLITMVIPFRSPNAPIFFTFSTMSPLHSTTCDHKYPTSLSHLRRKEEREIKQKKVWMVCIIVHDTKPCCSILGIMYRISSILIWRTSKCQYHELTYMTLFRHDTNICTKSVLRMMVCIPLCVLFESFHHKIFSSTLSSCFIILFYAIFYPHS